MVWIDHCMYCNCDCIVHVHSWQVAFESLRKQPFTFESHNRAIDFDTNLNPSSLNYHPMLTSNNRHQHLTPQVVLQFLQDHDFKLSQSSLCPTQLKKPDETNSIQSPSLPKIITENRKLLDKTIETIVNSFFQTNKMNQSIKSLTQKQPHNPQLPSPAPQKSVAPFTKLSNVPLSKINEHSIPIKTPLSFNPPPNNHLLLYPTLPIPIAIQKSFSISKSKKQCILCDKIFPGDMKDHFFQRHRENWKYTPFRCQEPG